MNLFNIIRTKTYRLYFPKLINIWNYIDYYIPLEFFYTKGDKLFILQILGIEDNSKIGTSLLKLQIDYDDYLEIHFNLFFIFHLKYEVKTNHNNDENMPWNFKK